MFCLGLSLGSLALLMLQHLSGGQWGLVGRRVFEAASRTCRIVALLFMPIARSACRELYVWAQAEAVAPITILQIKALVSERAVLPRPRGRSTSSSGSAARGC